MAETVLLIGGGLGNAVLFSIGRALKENGNRVLYVAGYRKPEDLFKIEEIEAVADHVIWCFESLGGVRPPRPQDFVYEGNVIEGLLAYATDPSSSLPLNEVDRIVTIGSNQMMAAVACARKTVLKPYLHPGHKALGSINSPMQCMMKEICGQCIQTNIDPLSGKTRVVFSCLSETDYWHAGGFRCSPLADYSRIAYWKSKHTFGLGDILTKFNPLDCRSSFASLAMTKEDVIAIPAKAGRSNPEIS